MNWVTRTLPALTAALLLNAGTTFGQEPDLGTPTPAEALIPAAAPLTLPSAIPPVGPPAGTADVLPPVPSPVATALEGICYPQNACVPNRRPYYLQADALFMTRSSGTGAGILLLPNFTGAAIGGHDLTYNVTSGPRVTFGVPLGAMSAAEFTYFGLYDLHSSLNFAGPARPVNAPPVLGSDFRLFDRTDVNNAEVNYRRWLGNNFSVLGGFRYVNLHDQLNDSFLRTPPGGPVPVHTRNETDNNLYGLQLGADWYAPVTKRFWFDFGGKAGIFLNSATSSASGFGPPLPPLHASAHADQTAFVGELALTAVYQVTPHFFLRGGYRVMWLEGVALAPDQLAATGFNNLPTINTGAGLLLHGALAGFELRW